MKLPKAADLCRGPFHPAPDHELPSRVKWSCSPVCDPSLKHIFVPPGVFPPNRARKKICLMSGILMLYYTPSEKIRTVSKVTSEGWKADIDCEMRSFNAVSGDISSKELVHPLIFR